MNITNRNILVTGGAGFIGSHLVDLLLLEGCRVRVIDNFVNGKIENIHHHREDSRFELVKGDITERAIIEKAVDGMDIVFHLACLGVRHSIKHPYENHRVNAEGTLIVLQEALKANVKRFVHCSSSEVYGTAQYTPMPETHPTFPCTIYGSSKLAGEAYARAYYKTYGFPAVIIRPFNTYGPRSHYEGDAGELIPKSIVRALNGQPVLIFGDGSQTRDFTYVEDMAGAIVESAKYDEMIGGTYNIGSYFEITIQSLVKKILMICNLPSGRIEYLQRRPGDVLRLFADATAFGGITNWKPEITLENGLKRTIEWFKADPEKIAAMLRQELGVNWE
jgi:UDP-glucose 4-epimerase